MKRGQRRPCGIVAAVFACGSLASPTAAFGQGAQPRSIEPTPARHRLVYSNLFAMSYNPLGLFEDVRLSYRYRLIDAQHPLLRDTFAGLGVAAALSPVFLRLGVTAEVQPLAMLKLSVRYDAFRYFGAFGVMQSFPDATAHYSDAEIQRLSDEKRSYVGGGRHLTLGALVQGKVGRFVFRFNTRFVFVDMTLRPGDHVYYDSLYDLLAPDRGWLVVNDSDLLYATSVGSRGGGFAAGLRYSVAHARYDETQLPLGHDNANTPMMRVGPFFAYRFFSRGARFDEPTVVLLAQWWLAHRYRTGRAVSQAVPFLGLALTFNGDLWRFGK